MIRSLPALIAALIVVAPAAAARADDCEFEGGAASVRSPVAVSGHIATVLTSVVADGEANGLGNPDDAGRPTPDDPAPLGAVSSARPTPPRAPRRRGLPRAAERVLREGGAERVEGRFHTAPASPRARRQAPRQYGLAYSGPQLAD